MTEIDITPDDQKVFDRLNSTGRITHKLKQLMTKQWNICSLCSRATTVGRPNFAGYDSNGVPLLVGACCADNLVELASPTYPGVTSTLNITVEDSQPLWRYMDFAKFVAMLIQKGLYFPRVDKLDDPFEAATGLARREKEWDDYYLEFFRDVVVSPVPGYASPDLSPEEREKEAQRLLREFKATSLVHRSKLVSCWHANTGESEALWRLYCPPGTAGLAIRTKAGTLWDATVNERSAVVGRVHYIDFRKGYAGINERVFCKRLSLSHESEVRAVIASDPRV